MNNTIDNKLDWADNLRVLATVSVIVVHVSASPVLQFGVVSNSAWWTGNIYDSIVRFCVPIFLMLTGALILPIDYKFPVFLKKKFVRLVLPLMFWSVVYIVYTLAEQMHHGEFYGWHETLKWIYKQIRFGSADHLWYLYAIIGIYLFLPIMGKAVRNCTENEILYFLIIWFLVMVMNQPFFANYKWNIDFFPFTGYFGYVILGYYLSLKSIDSKKMLTKLAIPFIAVGVAITAIGTYILCREKKQFVEDFYELLTPNVMMISVGVFLLFKNKTLRNKKLVWVRDFICKYSYGIYLAHILSMTLLQKIGMDWNFTKPVIAIPVTTFSIVCLSGIIVFLLNKIPFGKYISG